MDLLIQIDGQPATVYHPDALTLQAQGFSQAFGMQSFFEKPHPSTPGLTLRLVKNDATGRLSLLEMGTVKIDSTRDATSTVGLTVFRGWCYSKTDYTRLLELLRWNTPKAPPG